MNRDPYEFEDEPPLLPPHGNVPMIPGEQRHLPCAWCRKQTLVATLSQYGAKCFRCFEAYCREPQPVPRFMGNKRIDGPLAWAKALKNREESGERLTIFQREAWRTALHKRVPSSSVEEQP